MIVNKMYLKRLQTHQEEEITDCKKSKMEKHFAKPQILGPLKQEGFCKLAQWGEKNIIS